MLPGEYARSALQRGLQLENQLGVNPFKFGFVGGSDIHTGLSTSDDDNFFGASAYFEPGPDRADTIAKGNAALNIFYKGWQYASPGPTAVWAASNTRAGIFDALERRETYAATGPRIKVRFFGGYGFSTRDATRRDIARTGYRKGVPMGGDLATAPAGKTPSFLVRAVRDPIGANLDRVQIVKGWLKEDGSTAEKVFDVAWAGDRHPGSDGKLPPVGDSVDLTIPTWTNTIGAAELATVWIDPDFNPTQKAFYYARDLEIPTPRWTAYDRVNFNITLPPSIPLKTQERAYTSPIWYTP